MKTSFLAKPDSKCETSRIDLTVPVSTENLHPKYCCYLPQGSKNVWLRFEKTLFVESKEYLIKSDMLLLTYDLKILLRRGRGSFPHRVEKQILICNFP